MADQFSAWTKMKTHPSPKEAMEPTALQQLAIGLQGTQGAADTHQAMRDEATRQKLAQPELTPGTSGGGSTLTPAEAEAAFQQHMIEQAQAAKASEEQADEIQYRKNTSGQ